MARKVVDETIPHMCTEIERIIADFGQCKGIIHTHSYSINQRVFKHLADKYGNRIITMVRTPAVARRRFGFIAQITGLPFLSALPSPRV
jgi:hypothetical protein